VEALPSVLPSFSQSLVQYTESTFREEHIDVHTKTMVKEVTDKVIIADVGQPDGTKVREEIPYGLLVWATGNAPRPLVRDLITNLPAQNSSRRGLLVNDFLVVEGCEGIWALGDCTATKFAPTAQVAAQQGTYLSRLFNTMGVTHALEAEIAQLEKQANREHFAPVIAEKRKQLSRIKLIKPFEYSHQGSLAYIGSDKAIADLPFGFRGGNVAAGGQLTYYFWRSAYLSKLFSLRNRTLGIQPPLSLYLFRVQTDGW
jgi:NADH:ubiquinone reductase (non-electrogenic)